MSAMFTDNLLLDSALAKTLYFEIAKPLPVIDYHNHLSPLALSQNKSFRNITELWLRDDQYKHRLMRINGVQESMITGDSSDEIKFMKWMEVFPKTYGTPVFHWSQLEWFEVFGSSNLFQDNWEILWQKANERLGTNGLRARDFLKFWNCEVLCSSDDLTDDLSYHQIIASADTGFHFYPSLRGDAIVNVDAANFLSWLNGLKLKTQLEISSLDDYLHAVSVRIDDFVAAGCLLADHALDSGFLYQEVSLEEVTVLFSDLLGGKPLTSAQADAVRSFLLKWLGVKYGEKNIVLQLHIGAQRKTSSRLSRLAGNFGGFAAIGDPVDIKSLCGFLDDIEKSGSLPKTILYTLNPSDNERFGTLVGSFAGDGIKGKIQFGPAWWFNDHFSGIIKQLTDLSNYGMLSTFIGMTSDSRSFMSLSRHYYFRRVLCRLIADWAMQGLIPDDLNFLTDVVRSVSYDNAKQFFNLI